jgi:hypothetical protein
MVLVPPILMPVNLVPAGLVNAGVLGVADSEVMNWVHWASIVFPGVAVVLMS